MRIPPRALQDAAAIEPRVATDAEWLIVAASDDKDVVEHILERARTGGMICRVLWANSGPIRVYGSAEELWQDMLTS